MVQGYSKVSTFDKSQRQAFAPFMQQLAQMLQGGGTNIQQSPLYQSGSSYLQNLLSGSPEAFQAFEAPHLRQFKEQIVPALAERFSGLGSGAQSSSAFQQALGQAGSSLSEGLAALRAQLQGGAAQQALGYAQQPVSNLMGLGELGFGTQTQQLLPKQLPSWQQALLGLAGGASQGLGMAGGLWGAKQFGLGG